MADLVRVKGNSFYWDGVFSVGVYLYDHKAVLIDSGSSKDIAKDIDRTLAQANARAIAIISTHGHGDHCGGNAFFQHKYPDIKIFSTEAERPYIEDPLMAPITFCGAAPFEEVKKCKPIAPQQASKVTDSISPYQDQKIFIDGIVFDIITLPGHSRGMIGVKTPDNVLYASDVIFGEETFRKYPVMYYAFIGETLRSFEKLQSLLSSIDAAVLYHGGVSHNLRSLIQAHERHILETKATILSWIQKQPLSLEEITAKVMRERLIPDTLIAYVLTKAPMQAYAAELEREKFAETRVTEGICRLHAVVKT